MRVGISGCQNIGKSTVIKDFIEKWDMYTTPKVTYRDVLEEKGLSCNQETTTETQTILMNCICDQILNTDKTDNIITDRTPYDALAYSMWAHEKGIEGFDDEYISNQIVMAREASSFYDIIFHIPIVEGHDVELVEDNLRDTDPIYREEMDNIFSAMYKTYFEQTGPFFKWGDCPALTEIFGSPEERLEMLKLYVAENGNPYGEDESLVADALGEVTDTEPPEIII